MSSLGRSFKFAKRGLVLAIKQERNMRIHLFASALVVLCAILGKVEPWAWTALMLSCGLVLGAECLNSALETVCNRVQPSIDPLIRDAKDIAAGGVFICAIITVGVACVVFLRPVVLLELAKHPFEIGFLAIITPVAIWLLTKYRFRGMK